MPFVVTRGQKIAASIIGCTVEHLLEMKFASKKWCGSCRNWLAISNFGLNANRPDGLQFRCNNCKYRKAVR